MEQHQNYTREVLEHQEEALSKIVAKVPRGALVLDIGCGSGMMGRYLAEHSECVVDGVDIDPQAVELARAKYRKVGVFNLEHDSLLTMFASEAYDCIVMADVIEHIVHPEQLFEDVKKLLKPDGVLLFSIPNITHLAAGLELVLGKFDYQNSGLLDATHVRFYSRESFVAKLASSGIYVEEIDTVKKDVDQTEFAGFKLFPKNWIREITDFREDALTYQWIMTARLFKSSSVARRDPPIPGVSQNYLTLNSRLYWRSAFEQSFMEENSIPGRIALDESGAHTIIFDFLESNCSYPVVDIRIDPVSDKTNFVFKHAALVSESHQTLWATRELIQDELFNANIVSGLDSQGLAVFPTNSDPQWNVKIDKSILAIIGPGCKFQLGLNISADLICSTVVTAFDENRTKNLNDSLKHNADLATKEAEIVVLKASYEAEHAKLKAFSEDVSGKLSARESDMLHLQTLLNERSSRVNVLADELQSAKDIANEYALQASNLRSEIETSHVEISSLEKKLQENANEYALQASSLRSEIETSHVEISSLEKKLQDKISGCELLQQELKVTAEHLAERGRQLDRAEKNYAQTLETVSWKVTKPLRWLRRRIS